MKIQELSKRTGLSVYTIRYYEKEGLLDSRHVVRENNNYRNYSDEAVERLKLVKKFQSVDCSLSEIKELLQDKDTNALTTQQEIERVYQKIREIEHKRDEYDQMLDTLNWMIEYKMALESDPQKAQALLNARHARTTGSKIE